MNLLVEKQDKDFYIGHTRFEIIYEKALNPVISIPVISK
jgi:hypothetical protein